MKEIKEIIKKLQEQEERYKLSEAMRNMVYEGLDMDGRWSVDVAYQDGYADGLKYAINVLLAEKDH